MAIIDKKFIHFKNYDDFISQAGVGSVDNITTPTSGSEGSRNAVYGQIKGSSIVFIKDTQQIWTHGQLYNGTNIKTINGNSILGSGDITISGGSSDANVQAVDTGDILDDVTVNYATKTYVDGLVGDINIVLESIINS